MKFSHMKSGFHIWKGLKRISHVILFHIWNFLIWNQDFTYYFISHMRFHMWYNDLISHISVSRVKSEFHIWIDFTYEILPCEISISHVIWFHIWRFHIWNQGFTCDLISHMKVSYVKSAFHMWNPKFTCEIPSFTYEMNVSHVKSCVKFS